MTLLIWAKDSLDTLCKFHQFIVVKIAQCSENLPTKLTVNMKGEKAPGLKLKYLLLLSVFFLPQDYRMQDIGREYGWL
jgi:hypothetical protein